jgi:uncharacterized protein
MSQPAAPAQIPIPWADAMNQAKEIGLPAKQLYAITSTPTTGLGPVLANLEPHLAHQEKLETNGTIFAAGPLSSDDGTVWDGTGLFVYRADSLGAAKALAEQDPMHISGARTFRARAWMLNEGTISIRASYSTSKLEID